MVQPLGAGPIDFGEGGEGRLEGSGGHAASQSGGGVLAGSGAGVGGGASVEEGAAPRCRSCCFFRAMVTWCWAAARAPRPSVDGCLT